ncbi:MAG: metal ABC transporter permease [Bdellovibrionota bacterium]
MKQIFFDPFFEFDFLRHALLACWLLSFSSVPLGLFMSYRRLSLTGDSLSHAILPGIALGFWFYGLSIPAMTIGGLIAGFIIVLISNWSSKISLLKEDSTLAVTYLLALALGVFLVSIKGSPLDLFHFLFGNILSIDSESILYLGLATLLILTLLFIIYEPLKILTVDFEFAQFLKIKTNLIHILFMTLVVLNLVISFRVLGTLLSVGELIIPAITARLFFQRFSSQVIGGILISLASCFVGLLLSFHYNYPSGPTLILSMGVFFVFGLFRRWIHEG